MKMFDADKTKMIGLPYGEKNCDNILRHFHLIPERHGQTNGQNCYINIARQCSVLTSDKNETFQIEIVDHAVKCRTKLDQNLKISVLSR